MGRRRAQKPVGIQADAVEHGARAEPAGGARLAWSYLAAVLAAVITGLGVALADVGQNAACNSDDVTCTLGAYLVGALLSALVGVVVVAMLFRLGWEWALVCASLVVLMPTLLDVLGNAAWSVMAVAPLVAGAATWSGPRRPTWRPLAVGAWGLLAGMLAVVLTFVLPLG